jgi:hypothetical protein
MQRALAPFLTTGVALVAAAVVVANPLAPPSRDMQISTTQLSTSPDLLSPSDKSLLSALTPQLPLSGIGPALAQILAALAADADRISREVTSGVGPDVLAAVALLEQTAYRPDLMAAPFIESPNATPVAASTGFASAVSGSPVVQAVLNGLVADTGYLGGKVVEASVALVQVIIRVPEFVVTAVLDLLNGDIAGALETVKSVVKAFFGPGLIILDGIRDVLYGRQPPPVPPPTAAKQITRTAPDQPTTGGTAGPTRGDKAESGRKHVEAPSAAALRSTATTSKPAASADQTPTSTKPQSSKPASGSTRATAGSARESKFAASSGSSAD